MQVSTRIARRAFQAGLGIDDKKGHGRTRDPFDVGAVRPEPGRIRLGGRSARQADDGEIFAALAAVFVCRCTFEQAAQAQRSALLDHAGDRVCSSALSDDGAFDLAAADERLAAERDLRLAVCVGRLLGSGRLEMLRQGR